ncbi:CRE-UNC-24 protein [Caenorhabditis remanei]|uniref:CRE-UNC-24 protein n=1 Tax=Caenorhabditis remanei TaxID=31234 RepID=E3M6J8_CAERE|nr:CRE-UNC-24 protein [Caenorhabditis remanei]
MFSSSYKYSALTQNDPESPGDVIEMESIEGYSGVVDFGDPNESVMEYGMPEGSFDSVFTYAPYNDLDKMGYMGPKRHGMVLGSKYGNFTYTRDYGNDMEENIKPLTAVELLIYGLSMLFVVMTMPLSLLFALKFISTSEKLVVLRLGRAQKTRGPGIALVVPCIDTTHKVTTSITAFNVPPLQIITTDRGLVELGATVFLKIRDPIAAVCGVQDRNASVRTLANTMLYRYISKKRVCDVTNSQDRRIMAANFKDELGAFTCQFGTEITDVEMSDVKVVKEGENMGMSALSSVAKSDAGQQLWQVIGPAFEDFAKECAAEAKEKEAAPLVDLSDGPSTSTSVPTSSTSNESSIDIDHLITVASMAIDEHLVRLIGKVFQINCKDVDPICIDLKHGAGSAYKGTALNPDVVFESNFAVFGKILTKELSPVNAYMNGSLKVRGSIQDAMQLKYLVERMADWI